jgi:hypothetical protein
MSSAPPLTSRLPSPADADFDGLATDLVLNVAAKAINESIPVTCHAKENAVEGLQWWLYYGLIGITGDGFGSVPYVDEAAMAAPIR